MKRFAVVVCLIAFSAVLLAPVAVHVSNQSITPQNVADSNGPVPPIPPGSGCYLPAASTQA